MFRRLHPEIYDWAWADRERYCPRCWRRFGSKYDRGQCTRCSCVFHASTFYGLPKGVTAKEARRVFDERHERERVLWLEKVMALPLEKVARIPIRELNWYEWRDCLRFLNHLIKSETELFRWKHHGRFHVSYGFVAIREGTPVCSVCTGAGRWTPIEPAIDGNLLFKGIEAAIQKGDLDQVRSCLREGGDPNAVAEIAAWAYSDRDVRLLHVAAECGRLDVAKLLIEFGARPNVTFTTGETPLTLAVLNDHKDVADYLRGL